MAFGDNIDWNNEAVRQATATAEEHHRGGVRAISLDLIAMLKKHGASGRLLDCGCNIGRYCPPLCEAGFEYVGVDQATEALRICRERFPGVPFVQSMLWDMKFDTSFDVAISMAVLQHNTHDEKRRILPRIAAALKPGGFFAMQESTVLETTPTQLQQLEWIAMVEEFGFKLLGLWHPNPEYGVCDAYLFQKAV